MEEWKREEDEWEEEWRRWRKEEEGGEEEIRGWRIKRRTEENLHKGIDISAQKKAGTILFSHEGILNEGKWWRIVFPHGNSRPQ